MAPIKYKWLYVLEGLALIEQNRRLRHYGIFNVDSKNDMVIIKNPTISSIPTKSAHIPTATESDGTVDANTSEEITDFLNTFFKLYPTATEKELSYYVKNQALQTIGKDYTFVELVNPVYRQVENKVNVSVSVVYLDSATKATQVSQFELMLGKSDNWKILQSDRL